MQLIDYGRAHSQGRKWLAANHAAKKFFCSKFSKHWSIKIVVILTISLSSLRPSDAYMCL